MIYGQAADADKTADMIKRWHDFGGTHCCFDTLRQNFKDVEAHLEFVAAVRARI